MIFFDHLEKYAPNTAFIWEEGETTYGEFLRQADILVQHIPPRCLVFCLCENNMESLAGYVGLLRRRAVPVLLAGRVSQELLDELLNTYRPSYIWLSREARPQAGDGEVMASLGSYDLVRTVYQRDYTLQDDLALLLTTSGSTGSPKLVRLSYRNIESNARAIAQYLEIRPDDRPITTLPMNYTFGLSILHSHMICGCTVLLNDRTIMDKGFWTMVREQRATTFSGVPYTYEMLKKLRFATMNLPSLRTLTQAGGKLNRELSEEFAAVCAKKNIRFFVMYGQTEATARMSYLPSECAIAKAGSIGNAIPGGEFWLEDDQGQRVEGEDCIGELVYKGENVSLGYAQSRFDLSKPDENNGVLRTGDMARRDADGFYYIVGRLKRFLKLFGNRVNLDEIESLVQKHFNIECACTGRDDHLKAFVTSDVDRASVIAFLSQTTGIHPSAFSVQFIEEIPKNEAGKTLYAALDALGA